jgi:hypothetical protein
MDALLMEYLSESRQKALMEAQQVFQSLAGNPLYVNWRAGAINDFAFYDGTGQYHPNILKILEERGQSQIVVNKLRPMVNQVSGLEINTRGKFAFKSQSGREEQEQLSKALSHYGFAVQKKEGYSFQGSLRCRDSLICGLGWVRQYGSKKRIRYEHIHPLNILHDADDFTPQLTNQRHMGRMLFLTPEEIKTFWKKHAKKFDELAGRDRLISNTGNFTPEFFSRNSATIPSFANSDTLNGGKLLVVEVLQKQRRKYYCGTDVKGYYFETFSEEEAEKIAASKSDIEEEEGMQIMRTVFCNDILLEYAPIEPNIPNQKDFPYIPLVWMRRTSDGVPVGWMEDAKDLQREANYRKLKEIVSLNSVRAVVDQNAFHGMDADEIRAELSRPDSVLFKTGPGQVDIVPNLDISNAMIKAGERIDYEIQQVLGMYSDSMGQATNATSGVAIRQRQIGTSKNLAFGFDAFSYVKEREGEAFLNLLQHSNLENILVNITLDDDEKETFILNLMREVNGKKVMFNDIRTIPLDIYIDIVPDYDSSFDEQKATLENLLANPQAPLILQNPYLLKILIGGRHSDKISEAMMQLNQQQEAMRAGIPQAAPEQNMAVANPTQLGGM